MTDFFIRVTRQLEQNLPFVIYSKPGDSRLIGQFQQNDHLYFSEDLTDSGFVMAPFGDGSRILFPDDFSEEIIVAASFGNDEALLMAEAVAGDDANKLFVDMVNRALGQIGEGVLFKVVLSRVEKVKLQNFDPILVFEKLARTYQNAFTYCWFHPKVGMWLGATPEQLIRTDGHQFQSVALAGTRPFNGSSSVKWDVKEQEEQQFVTDYIIESLREISSEISVSSPYTARAGNLLHIKTDIEVTVEEGTGLQTVVAALHPTPAVCGVPKEQALDFIANNEHYDREFYSGFLGEIHKDGRSDLYVNLRCMKVSGKDAHLYVGCGITKDSDPEKEYLETVNKTMTLKRIIK